MANPVKQLLRIVSRAIGGKSRTELMLDKGQKEFRREEFDEAVRSFGYAIEFDKQNWRAYNNRGNTKSILSDLTDDIEKKAQLLSEAVADYEQSIEINSDLSENQKALINLKRDFEALERLSPRLAEKRYHEDRLRNARLQGLYLEEKKSSSAKLLRFSASNTVLVSSIGDLVPDSTGISGSLDWRYQKQLRKDLMSAAEAELDTGNQFRADASLKRFVESRFAPPNDELSGLVAYYKDASCPTAEELLQDRQKLKNLAEAVFKPSMKGLPQTDFSRDGKKIRFVVGSQEKEFGSNHLTFIFKGEFVTESSLDIMYGSESEWKRKIEWDHNPALRRIALFKEKQPATETFRRL